MGFTLGCQGDMQHTIYKDAFCRTMRITKAALDGWNTCPLMQWAQKQCALHKICMHRPGRWAPRAARSPAGGRRRARAAPRVWSRAPRTPAAAAPAHPGATPR